MGKHLVRTISGNRHLVLTRFPAIVTDGDEATLQLSFITPEDQRLYMSLFKSAAREETKLPIAIEWDLLAEAGVDKYTASRIQLVSTLPPDRNMSNLVGRLSTLQNLGIYTFQNLHWQCISAR